MESISWEYITKLVMVEDTIAELEEEGFVISYEPIGNTLRT